MGESVAIPSPSLVVLVGPPASGKSTWAAEHFDPRQVLSTDDLRGIIGEHDLDLDATSDAFDLLDRMLEMRLGRGLTTVIDTTGLDADRRAVHREAARRHGVNAVAVRFPTSAAECRRRNRQRAHPVPVKALDAMVKKYKSATVELDHEGWDLVMEPDPVRVVTARLATAADSTGPQARSRTNRVDRGGGLTFGLHIASFEWPGDNDAIAATLARIAGEAEEAGFDSIWVMDHLIQIPQVGREWDAMLESYTTLGFLAGLTERARLGVLVSAVTLRKLGHLAKLVATLDVLSGGRAMAGLGAGSSAAEHDALAIPFGSPRQRLDLLEDALRALPLFWGPGSPSFEGRTTTIPKTICYPRPLQEHVPIIVGGSGEKRTLRLAAEYASGCNLFGDLAAVRRRVEVLHRHCLDLDRDPDEVEVTHLGSVVVGRDASHLRMRIEGLRPANVGPERFAARANAGTVADHVEGYRALADAGVSTAIISTPDPAAPGVIETLAGVIAAFDSE